MTKSACGSCRACCRALEVVQLPEPKPEWRMYRHSSASKGCTIYAARPEECRTYECLWLQTQSGETPMPIEMRPDRSHVVVDAQIHKSLGEIVVARVAPEHLMDLHKPAAAALLTGLVNTGHPVLVRCGSKTSRPVRIVSGSPSVEG